MGRILALLCLVVSLFGCTGHVASVGELLAGYQDTIPPKLTFHMDTAFTGQERDDAAQAVKVWKVQTGGLADITLVYDLDFDRPDILKNIVDNDGNYVVRYESDMSMVYAADAEAGCMGCVLGWMTGGGVHNPQHNPVRGAFVADRITGPGIRLQVMIHEFGHALGLPHVPSRQALMYPSVIPGRTACLKQPDLVAFCEVNACGDTKMIPCE